MMSALRWVESQSSPRPGKMCYIALCLKNSAVLCALQHMKHLQQREKCYFVSWRCGFGRKTFPGHGFIRNFRSLRQLMCCRVTKTNFHGSGQKSKIDAASHWGESLVFPHIISRNRRTCKWEQCPDFCPAIEVATALTHTDTHLGST